MIFILMAYFQAQYQHFKYRGIRIFKVRISVPVLISALLFGLYHVIPRGSNNIVYTLAMFISPTILGVVAGYYQEKYENNAYAIIVHMSGNLVGLIAMVF